LTPQGRRRKVRSRLPQGGQELLDIKGKNGRTGCDEELQGGPQDDQDIYGKEAIPGEPDADA